MTTTLFRHHPLSRRNFLRLGGLGVATLGLSACAGGALPQAAQPTAPPADAKAAAQDAALVFTLTARAAETQILPGAATRVLSYATSIEQGDPPALNAVPGSYLGPIVRVASGATVTARLRNELDMPTNVHWHGLIVPAEVDGQPSDVVAPGSEAEYTFTVHNRPGTYWFHPHPHGHTAEQAYRGLAGLFIVSDPAEAALGLPVGTQDIPLVLQDRIFDADNQLVYITGGMVGMMNQMMGVLGDRVLVNGQPDVVLPVATQPYRLRLLNGSNARIFKLGWSTGAPLTVLATDGGLLAEPATVPYVMLAPGERIEVWVDFGPAAVGDEIKLVSLAYEGVEAGGGMMGELFLPNGVAFDVMTFAVTESVQSNLTLPAVLLPVEMLAARQAVNAASPRPFIFAMDDAMNWTINGRTYEMDVVADDERVRFGDVEVWEFSNRMAAPVAAGTTVGMDHSAHAQHGAAMTHNGMRDFMAHPVHVHGVQFQVLSREVDLAQRAGWETIKDGLVDQGWKDTVLIMPGERVQVVTRFDGYRGLYVIHCHNLEHEDGGMMRHFEIV